MWWVITHLIFQSRIWYAGNWITDQDGENRVPENKPRLWLFIQCVHLLRGKFLPVPSGICSRRPGKKGQTVTNSPFIPAAVKGLNKTHCSRRVLVRPCVVIFSYHPLTNRQVFHTRFGSTSYLYLLDISSLLGQINNILNLTDINSPRHTLRCFVVYQVHIVVKFCYIWVRVNNFKEPI